MRGSTKLIVLGLTLILGVTSGCALQDRRGRRSTQLDCVWNADQQNTFLARWSVAPIRIAVQQGAFVSGLEQNAIRSAADTWNRFFRTSMGHEAFDHLVD